MHYKTITKNFILLVIFLMTSFATTNYLAVGYESNILYLQDIEQKKNELKKEIEQNEKRIQKLKEERYKYERAMNMLQENQNLQDVSKQSQIVTIKTYDATDIYKNSINSMLFVKTKDKTGSGVIVLDDGTFITCFHVIAMADSIRVELSDGSEYYVDGFRYINPIEDIAILTIDTKRKFSPIKIKKENTMDIGQKVYTISNPQGLQFAISDGILNQYNKDYVQFSAPISPGSSGGALLDNNGQLIGIINSSLEESQNINFATPNVYYASQIYNTPIKNIKYEKWSDFVLHNAGEEQYKLTLMYAINCDDYPLLYQYLKPYVALRDYPATSYALAAFIAYNAYLVNSDNSTLQDAISWYENSLNNNLHEELCSLALFILYILNYQENEYKIENLIPTIDKYPESQELILEALNCEVNDDMCFEKVGEKIFLRIYNLTNEIYTILK